jgi:hypothetical protein
MRRTEEVCNPPGWYLVLAVCNLQFSVRSSQLAVYPTWIMFTACQPSFHGPNLSSQRECRIAMHVQPPRPAIDCGVGGAPGPVGGLGKIWGKCTPAEGAGPPQTFRMRRKGARCNLHELVRAPGEST